MDPDSVSYLKRKIQPRPTGDSLWPGQGVRGAEPPMQGFGGSAPDPMEKGIFLRIFHARLCFPASRGGGHYSIWADPLLCSYIEPPYPLGLSQSLSSICRPDRH